jgi:hypothetical protein
LLNETGRYYESKGITWEDVRRFKPSEYPINMAYQNSKLKNSEPNHTSLSIIDRAIRTIRDLAYNMSIGVITPIVMNHLVELYNNAPHRGLSQIMEFEVSPSMVQNDIELEREICRRTQALNYSIRYSDGFEVPVGTNVYIYNSKDAMSKRRSLLKPFIGTVVGFNGVLYDVQRSDNNEVQKCSRSMLKPLES